MDALFLASDVAAGVGTVEEIGGRLWLIPGTIYPSLLVKIGSSDSIGTLHRHPS